MTPDINCLMLSKGRLTEEIREVLLQAARAIVQNARRAASVQNDLYEGIVETEGKYVSFGAVSGQQFSADLATPDGVIEVTFVVQSKRLGASPDEGLWHRTVVPTSHIPDALRPGANRRRPN